MRMPRIKTPGQETAYHCMSRIVDGHAPLTAKEQEKFKQLMRQQAAFCGVDILTYCIMPNHFHILVRVPAEVVLDDRQLVNRLRRFYGEHLPPAFQAVLKAFKKSGKLSEDFRAQCLRRMGDISAFMKELKQRFSRWYNALHERHGTLWSERFKSTVVQNQPGALTPFAAYVDLNPVRAGMVEDPRDYRFCGYTEALSGGQEARAGLQLFLQGGSWKESLKLYRQYLFVRAGKAGQAGKQVLEAERIRQVLKEGGELTPAEALRLRIRYFNDGVALGSPDFVEAIFQQFRSRFSPRRKNGARKLKGLPFKDLAVIRALRKNVTG